MPGPSQAQRGRRYASAFARTANCRIAREHTRHLPELAAYPSLQTIYCDIVNLNTSPKNATIDVVDYFGNVIISGSFTILPSQGMAVGDPTGSGAWCRFTVDGSAKKYRAMAIYDNASAYTVSLPAQ
jgi:hypothetical protein